MKQFQSGHHFLNIIIIKYIYMWTMVQSWSVGYTMCLLMYAFMVCLFVYCFFTHTIYIEPYTYAQLAFMFIWWLNDIVFVKIILIFKKMMCLIIIKTFRFVCVYIWVIRYTLLARCSCVYAYRLEKVICMHDIILS